MKKVIMTWMTLCLTIVAMACGSNDPEVDGERLRLVAKARCQANARWSSISPELARTGRWATWSVAIRLSWWIISRNWPTWMSLR